jgi:SOS-response transcriptional repressor LexA
MSVELTKLQADLLGWVVSSWTRNNRGPSIRELMRAFNVSSPSSIQQRVKALKRMGLVSSQPHVPHSLRVTDEGREWLEANREVVK